MQSIGKYSGRQVYLLDYSNFADQLPDKDWVCLAISNLEPDMDRFDQFVRTSISKNIFEFKGHGKFAEKLHDLFDETMVDMELAEKRVEIGVVTTWHHDETLADTFWQCFHATCLPETSDPDNIKVVCVDLDGVDRAEELQSYLKAFELGRLPSERV